MGEFVLYLMKRGPVETNKRHRPNGKVIENQTWQLNICSISLGYGKRSDICTLIFCKESGKNRNSVRAEVVENLLDYSWSSYPTYVAARRKEPWLTTSLVLGMYGGSRKKFIDAQPAYAGKEKSLLDELRYGLFLGGRLK